MSSFYHTFLEFHLFVNFFWFFCFLSAVFLLNKVYVIHLSRFLHNIRVWGCLRRQFLPDLFIITFSESWEFRQWWKLPPRPIWKFYRSCVAALKFTGLFFHFTFRLFGQSHPVSMRPLLAHCECLEMFFRNCNRTLPFPWQVPRAVLERPS